MINEIAKRHDGGGHPLASGANSYSLEENDQIYQELQEVVSIERRLRTDSQPFILVMGFSFVIFCGKIKLVNFIRRLIMEKIVCLSLSLLQ